MNDQIAIGAVRTTHGVRGYLKVRSFSGELDHFFNLECITLRKDGSSRRFDVEAVKPNGSQLLMKLKGIDSPEQGKLYSNWEIWVSRDKAAPLNENEFYHADLVGCRLYLDEREVGTVLSVIEGGSGELLEIEREDDSKKLIPFNQHFIGSIKVAEKKLSFWKAGYWIEVYSFNIVSRNRGKFF